VPATPAGRVFDGWLAAFNPGDAERVRAPEAAHGDPSKAPDRMLSFRARTGGFGLLRVGG
jgi:hypothetical protein